MKFRAIYGVDFSGARLAGRNTWVARIERRKRDAGCQSPWRLAELARLEDLCGTASRAEALGHLVELIGESEGALWSLDFPFGLPVEILGERWARQFEFIGEWGEDGYGAGLECVRRSKELCGAKHIRRLTDIEERAPFDPYHTASSTRPSTGCATYSRRSCDARTRPSSRSSTVACRTRAASSSKPARPRP